MIFVTGGSGLIGSHLLYQLVSDGKRVKALHRKTSNLKQVRKVFSWYSNDPDRLFNRIEWTEGDILDYFTIEELLQGIEEVYHCAAKISFNPADRENMLSNNVQGTANMVNASLENGVRKFCHVSSVSALGQSQNGYSTDELTTWIPSKRATFYSESKFYSETEIWRGIEEGLNAVIVNPSVVLGPGNWDSGSPKLFKAVSEGLKFYTKGITGFVDVKDVVKAMISLMDDSNFDSCKNQRFLLNAENWSYQEIFNNIAVALQKPKPGYFASGFLLGLAWRASAALNRITNLNVPITRETATAANSKSIYDGSKIIEYIGFNYTPITQSIKQTSSFLLEDNSI